eukprot:TRINITY_DN10584_c0_g1_i2.p2 TRINITY_DN10584_c0_g1~~TRINITY_DN10584_c0_g1_i2.p2  ORF type:complete len:319 (+),score=79.50 TRINITY_DN10584_c0_g1_i2:1783-2739(+)
MLTADDATSSSEALNRTFSGDLVLHHPDHTKPFDAVAVQRFQAGSGGGMQATVGDRETGVRFASVTGARTGTVDLQEGSVCLNQSGTEGESRPEDHRISLWSGDNVLHITHGTRHLRYNVTNLANESATWLSEYRIDSTAPEYVRTVGLSLYHALSEYRVDDTAPDGEFDAAAPGASANELEASHARHREARDAAAGLAAELQAELDGARLALRYVHRECAERAAAVSQLEAELAEAAAANAALRSDADAVREELATLQAALAAALRDQQGEAELRSWREDVARAEGAAEEAHEAARAAQRRAEQLRAAAVEKATRLE